MKEAITAYFDQINKSGGINGRKLELIAFDDGYETDRTVANTKLIDEHKVFALVQFYGSSPTTQAMNDVFGPAKSAAGRHHLRRRHTTPADQGQPELSPLFIKLRASYADETEAIVNQRLSAFGPQNIAVFYQNDGFGKSGLEGTTAALKKLQHRLPRSARSGATRSTSTGGQGHRQGQSAGRGDGHPVQNRQRLREGHAKTNQHHQFMTLSPVGAGLPGQGTRQGCARRWHFAGDALPFNDTTPVVRRYQRLLQANKNTNYGYCRNRRLRNGQGDGRAIRKSGRI